MQFDAHAQIRVLRPSKANGCRSAFCCTTNGDFRMNAETFETTTPEEKNTDDIRSCGTGYWSI